MVAAVPLILKAGSFILSNGMAMLSAVSGIAGAVSMHNAGVDAQQQAYNQAAQLDQQAKQERAVAHMDMARQRREAKARASENQLILSTGGFAGDDPSSVHLLSETAGQETLEQLMTKALGEQRARNLENQGAQLRIQGKQQRKSATLGAFAQALGAAASWGDRYGGGAFRRSASASGAKFTPGMSAYPQWGASNTPYTFGSVRSG